MLFVELKEYLTSYYADKKLPSIGSASSSPGRRHPILRNRLSGGNSTDDESPASAPLTPTCRHAKFHEVVEVVEYQLRDRVIENSMPRHEARLNDEDDHVTSSVLPLDREEMKGVRVAVDDDSEPLIRNIFSPLSSPDRHFIVDVTDRQRGMIA